MKKKQRKPRAPKPLINCMIGTVLTQDNSSKLGGHCMVCFRMVKISDALCDISIFGNVARYGGNCFCCEKCRRLWILK